MSRDAAELMVQYHLRRLKYHMAILQRVKAEQLVTEECEEEEHDFDPIDHDKLQQRYLIWYTAHGQSRFAVGVDSYEHLALDNAAHFIGDGFTARVMKVTVENGQPTAEWVT